MKEPNPNAADGRNAHGSGLSGPSPICFITATILASGEKFTGGCSARTDCVDDELLELMASAGCTGSFLVSRRGAQRLQHVINKKWRLIEGF